MIPSRASGFFPNVDGFVFGCAMTNDPADRVEHELPQQASPPMSGKDDDSVVTGDSAVHHVWATASDPSDDLKTGGMPEGQIWRFDDGVGEGGLGKVSTAENDSHVDTGVSEIEADEDQVDQFRRAFDAAPALNPTPESAMESASTLNGPATLAAPSAFGGASSPARSSGGSAERGRSKARAQGGSDALTQSLFLMATMLVLLATARYAVPRIVEEIRYAWHRGELRAEYETGIDGLKNVSLDALSDAYQMVTATVGPSVVHIDVQRRVDPSGDALSALLPGGGSPSDQGSGVIVDQAGYVLTNRHVISEGDQISVTLSDGRRLPATVLGSDSLTDLAVLKIDADRLIPIRWGDSDRCKVGSPVWAVGSPFGLDRTVTFGILSGKHRMVRASNHYGAREEYQDFMQSDVAVNPGNSGGPLVDARGTLVGINTAIVGETYQGVSFSIPSNVVRKVYDKIRLTGVVQRGWLGVQLAQVDDDSIIGEDLRIRGARVEQVNPPDSPAGRAGVLPGDIIRAVDGVTVTDVGHLMRLIGNAMAGANVRLEVIRDGQTQELQVLLGKRPDHLDR